MTQRGGRGETQEMSDQMRRLLVKKAEDCVQYILFCTMAESKSVVKRADLNKNVIKEYSASFKLIYEHVKSMLEQVFGLIIEDASGDDEKMEKFTIKSKFKYDSKLSKQTSATGLVGFVDRDELVTQREFQQQTRYAMIMISLSLIFMNENEMDETLFFESLKKLDVSRDEKRHKYLGDVFRFFTVDLVKDGYLEHEIIRTMDPPGHRFKWGSRAHLEVSKHDVLKFVCQVYGGADVCKPSDWTAQYADAQKEEDFSGDDENDANDANDDNDDEPQQGASDDDEDDAPTQNRTQRNNAQQQQQMKRETHVLL